MISTNAAGLSWCEKNPQEAQKPECGRWKQELRFVSSSCLRFQKRVPDLNFWKGKERIYLPARLAGVRSQEIRRLNHGRVSQLLRTGSSKSAIFRAFICVRAAWSISKSTDVFWQYFGTESQRSSAPATVACSTEHARPHFQCLARGKRRRLKAKLDAVKLGSPRTYAVQTSNCDKKLPRREGQVRRTSARRNAEVRSEGRQEIRIACIRLFPHKYLKEGSIPRGFFR